MPVGAFGGPTKIMNHVAPLGNVYQAGTLSANPIALSAGIAMIKNLLKKGFYSQQEKKTQYLVDKIMKHVKRKGYPLHMPHIGSIFWFAFSKTRIKSADQINPESMQHFNKMHKALLENGIYLGPSSYEVGFVSKAHTKKDLSHAAEVINGILDKIF